MYELCSATQSKRLFYRYCYKLKEYQLTLLGIFLPLIFNFIIVIICDWLHTTDDAADEEQLRLSITTIIAMTTIGPLLETVFFQYLPLKIGHYLFKGYKYHYCIIIILFSLIFAFIHPSKIFYFMAMLSSGLVWSFICFILIRKKQSPLLYTTMSHAGYNCAILIVRVLVLDINLIQ